MIKTFGWRTAQLILAIVFALSYASLIFGVPTLLERFADFKIEMPAPTLMALNLAHLLTTPIYGIAFGVVMLSLTFAIATGEKFAWWTGLALSLGFGLCLISTGLPLIAIANALSGGEEVSSGISWLQIAPVAVVALLPAGCFLLLRRAFWRTNQNVRALE